jgi:hypothetical protein
MKTDTRINTHTDRQQNITPTEAQAPRYDEIKLGIDWHADHYRVSRMIDGTPPQPAQRFNPKAFLSFAQEQLKLGKKVYSCYEAGAGGYVLHRSLTKLGVQNYVVHPVKLDRRHTGGGLALPKWGDVLFRRLRSSYPLAGCSPAEPASVSLDKKNPSPLRTHLQNQIRENQLMKI